MRTDAATVIDQAIAWHLKQADMPAEDWPSFVAWLEESEAHRSAYDAVARQDRLLAGARFPTLAAANDNPPARRWWWAAAGAAGIAAALALTVMPSSRGGGEQRFATRDGERRTVTLPDGSELAMNGGTAFAVASGGRSARLERGEIMLRVVHDPAAPFRVIAGDQVIEDLGTRFDVVRTDRTLSVAVAEGAVALRGGGRAIRLAQGDALTVDVRTGAAVRATVAAETVGGWRSGVLSFDGAPLADVAAALRRAGMEVELDARLSRRPFTGMIRLTGAADRDIPHLADLIGATWRRDGERWVLAEGGLATP